MNNQTNYTDQLGGIETGEIFVIIISTILFFFLMFVFIICYPRIKVFTKTIIRRYIRKNGSINKPILIINEDEFESPNKNIISEVTEEKSDYI